MSALELFRVICGFAAGLCTLGLVLPGRAPNSAHRAALLGTAAGSWLIMAATLIPRDDIDRITNRPLAIAIGGVGVVIVAWIATLLSVRFPLVWFVALALALPIRLPVEVGSQRANLLIPLYGVIFVGVLAIIVRARQGRLHAAPASVWISVPLALFTAFTLASLLWTSDWTEATSKVVFFYIPFALLFVLVISWWSLLERPVRPLAATTVGVGTIAAIVALVQFTTRSIWWNSTLEQGNRYNKFFRTNGIFFDPNILGRLLVLTLLVALAYIAATDDRVQMWIVAGASIVIAAGLVVTFSRSSALMLLAGLAILSAKIFGIRRTVGVALLAIILVGTPSLAASSRLRDQVSSLSAVADASEGRSRLVKGGVDLWKSEPVIGVGIGSFAQRYADTLSERARRRTRVVISHTAPITVLAELGLVGIGLLALLAAGTLTGLAAGIRRHPERALMLVTILAVLVGIFIHSVLYSAFFEDPYVWVLLAAGATMAAHAGAASSGPKPMPEDG